jgi:SAM-dependent methyltransferase
VGKAQRRNRIKSAIKARNADVYAGFLLPHLRADMVILDCGCGEATITMGLAEAVPAGWVVGVDLEKDSLQLPAATRPQSGGVTSLAPWLMVDGCLFTPPTFQGVCHCQFLPHVCANAQARNRSA